MTGGGFIAVDSDDGNSSRLTGHSHVSGPKYLHLPAMTIGLFGVQLFWSVEQSYGSPYLLSLGLSKSAMAMVFLAGPLSGLIMQPLIGVLADSCTSRFGRRRPYMMGGILVCILAMLLLGWTKQVAGWFTPSKTLVLAFGVLSIYIIDFSINAVMAVDRALLVDVLPSSDQPAANAWAARMMSIGSVAGFYVGNLSLPSILPFFGNTELEVLSILASILLLGGHVVTMLMVKEKVLLQPKSSGSATATFLKQMKEIITTARILPRVIKQICIIQFFTWLSWFPLLFYTTIYIGDLHKRAYYTSLLMTESVGPSSVGMLGGSIGTRQAMDPEELEEESTRLGSRALFLSAVVSLLGNFILPFFVFETRKKKATHTIGHSTYEANGVQNGGYASKTRSWGIPDMLKVHLASLWASSHAVFAACMFGTFFTSTVTGATLLITATGFSWAIIMWAPLALLAEAILTEPAPGSTDASAIMLQDTRSRPDVNETIFEDPGLDSDAESDSERQIKLDKAEARRGLIGNHDAGISRVDLGRDHSDDEEEGEDAVLVGRRRDLEEADGDREHEGGLSAKVGIILGIQNIFVVIPQFFVTGLASIVFAIFDQAPPVHVRDGDVGNSTVSALVRDDEEEDAALLQAANSNSVVYIFRLGGVAALVAFVLCWRLARELKHR
ncbi:MFS general substrate transporter [Hymenopellis radicata]|nr:MFS general substrate transporter [Hymenopellis radicata]